jgi:hypothetical protein
MSVYLKAPIDAGSGSDVAADLAAHITGPSAHTKSQVGLGNVDNTSDLDKPISTATQSALDTLDTDISNLFSLVGDTFESVSKNIRSWNAVSSTTNSISYSDGVSTIVKTITKPDAVTIVITLTGDTPAGIDLVKTITLNGANLPTWSYS